ncbi:MAG: thioredoxin family protein [Muricauda sp.]|nr:thioredoxin family protein [Allomuricauda sp.]
MKRGILYIVFVFSVSIYAQDVQLHWQKDLVTATELSKIENQPVLVYFTKDDCKSCQQFYSNVFKSDAFKSIANNFVYLMVDGSNQDIKSTDINVIKQRRLIIHYNKTNSFPAVMALDKNGDIIGEPLTKVDGESITAYLTYLKTLIK